MTIVYEEVFDGYVCLIDFDFKESVQIGVADVILERDGEFHKIFSEISAKFIDDDCFFFEFWLEVALKSLL